MAHRFMKLFRWVLVIVLVIIVVAWLKGLATPVEEVHITVNVNGEEVHDVQVLLDVLDKEAVTATFFITGDWAQSNPDFVEKIASSHEIACHTTTGARLAQIPLENYTYEIVQCKEILEGLSGTEVIGFRAPASEVNREAFELLKEHYEYDSSIYSKYTWFWERPLLDEVPITSVLLIPLEETFGVHRLRLGDTFYFLARKARQKRVVIALKPSIAAKHQLDVQFFIASHKADGATVRSIAEAR